jgi:hypothetical protein
MRIAFLLSLIFLIFNIINWNSFCCDSAGSSAAPTGVAAISISASKFNASSVAVLMLATNTECLGRRRTTPNQLQRELRNKPQSWTPPQQMTMTAQKVEPFALSWVTSRSQLGQKEGCSRGKPLFELGPDGDPRGRESL